VSSLTSSCRRLGADPRVHLAQFLLNLTAIGNGCEKFAQWLPDLWKRLGVELERIVESGDA
jgi:hypothetical protein